MRGKGPSCERVDHGRAGRGQLLEVESDRLERPARRAVASREAAPHVLVRIDEEIEAVAARTLGDGADVVEIRLVVAAGPGVLDRLPGDQQAKEPETPRAESAEVLVGFLQGKGAAHEGDVAVVEEALAPVGRAVRPGRNLAAAPQIDPAQDQRAAQLVHEPGPVDSDRHRRGAV